MRVIAAAKPSACANAAVDRAGVTAPRMAAFIVSVGIRPNRQFCKIRQPSSNAPIRWVAPTLPIDRI
ncbi:hypothetical protein [Sphingomonas sp. UV9]|uniref:hypothetical protein n=1 Tax=Sphingomonas sp. UV9 TaxID=1851410 RepID=UPI0013E8B794|nr:hypothetical protein [Sphingomonas sp. UV9]